MMIETVDFDSELQAAERRARELRDAKERRRDDLRLRLRALQDRLSAATTAPPPANANDAPDVRQLCETFNRAQTQLREHQPRRPRCGVPQQHWLMGTDYGPEITRYNASLRAFEEREQGLLAACHAAAVQYDRAVSAKIDELRAAEGAAERAREIAAAELKVQIAGVEQEILKLRG